jgi:oligosaccharide repeat unit polymerase
MKLGDYINPFILFPFAFLFLIGVYSLGWSNLFPDLSLNTYIFVVLLSSFFIIIGFVFKRLRIVEYFDLTAENLKKDRPLIVVFILGFLFFIDVVYSGVVPILAGDIEQYESFGMPIVDPLILSLLIFYSIYWFHSYLSSKEKKYLLYVFFNIIIAVLMARRAALVYVFLGFLFVFIQKINRIKIFSLVIIVSLLVGFSSFFGYLGNTKSGLDNDHATTYMGASDKFYNSGVANVHYITYLYVCSPIANFQLTINKKDYKDSFSALIMSNYVPDFIANKVTNIFAIKWEDREIEMVIDVLNVGTYFVGGYITYGWLGVVVSSFFMIFFAFSIYFLYPKSSPYHATVNAFLCAIFLMALFANVFRLAAVCFVFIIPLFLNFLNRIKFPTIRLR